MKNNVNYDLYRKNVKVYLKNGKTVTGIFNNDFDDEKSILVGLCEIEYDEIEKMELYNEKDTQNK